MTMRVSSPDVTKTNQHCLWQVAGLSDDDIALVDKINHGPDGTVAKHIFEWANVTPSKLCKAPGIPNAAFNRSIKNCFTADQSERLTHTIRIIERTVELFEGGKEVVHRWLDEANRGLSWRSPTELISSETDAFEMMRLITRIEHGMYSRSFTD